MSDYVHRDEFRHLVERQDSLEEAMNDLKQDWLDTQALLPTKREVEQLDLHLGKQDRILWAIAVALIAGLIIALVLH